MSRTLPIPSKISQPFWDSCKAGRMRLQCCADCGTYAFYPVYICPECASRKLNWTPVSGRGTIHTFTIATKATFETDGPLVVALVELEEGAMMVTNVQTKTPETLAIGDAVRLVYEKVSDDITLPMFEPA
jgi:uncharacterized OB-fold protein